MKKIKILIFLGLVVVGLSQNDSYYTPLGLQRLTEDSTISSKGKLEPNQYEIDNLDVTTSDGVRTERKGNHDVVTINDGSSFSRPIRSRTGKNYFVSFSAIVSVGSVFEVTDAKISISESSTVDGYASVMVKNGPFDWQDTQLSVPLETYEGLSLATLPVLTVRIDPSGAEFDVYSDSRLLIEGLPLNLRSGFDKFRLTAGSNGAWLLGLVQSDINPLYVDENLNGVDDDFEISHRGQLQASDISKQQRKELIRQWHATERYAFPPALLYSRPKPDGR